MTDSEMKKVLTQKGEVAVFAETPDYLVLLKGAGIPSAPLKGGKRSAFEAAADKFPEICSVKGKNDFEGGLVHRIDNDTSGLLLIARTQRFYDLTQAAQNAGAFVKTYTAYCAPQPSKTGDIPSGANAFLKGKTCKRIPAFRETENPYTIESRFRPLGEKGAMVKPVFEGEATRADVKKAGDTVYYTTVTSLTPFLNAALKKNLDFPDISYIQPDVIQNIQSDFKSSGLQVVRACCSITAGFRHQVRSHLAATGYPVIGDKLYGVQECRVSDKTQMLFFASGLQIKEAGLSVSLPENVLDEIAKETLY